MSMIVNSRDVTSMRTWLESKYGKIRTTRGKVHTYLGMNLDYTSPGKVKVSMVDYLKEAIDVFPEDTSGSLASPAADHLFTTNKECKKNGQNMGRIFHNIVAKLFVDMQKS